jgi:hypothetical protein
MQQKLGAMQQTGSLELTYERFVKSVSTLLISIAQCVKIVPSSRRRGFPMERKTDNKFDDYNNNFNKENYDRIAVFTPKGGRDKIKEHARACGESANAFINRAIKEQMKRDSRRLASQNGGSNDA